VMHFAVSSSEQSLSLLASREVLKNNNTPGMFELIKKYDQLTPELRELLVANVEKLGLPIRMALLNENSVVQDNAVNVIRELRPYSLIPLLLQHLELGATSHLGIVQWAVTHLADYFSQEFRGLVPRKPSYGYVLTSIVDALDRGFASWQRHEREIFIDVFFRLSERLSTLSYATREMTTNPHHPAHNAFARKLIGSQDPCVMRFLARQLESTIAPNSLLVAAASRTDRAFVRMLLETVGYSPAIMLQKNLLHIRRFDWLDDIRSRLNGFDEGCHRFLVEMVYWSGLNENEKMLVYENVLRFGGRAGKIATIEKLRQSLTPNSDRLILLAADGNDPEVQAAALSQLRTRNIKGATSKLLSYIDSPHQEIRQVVSDELIEFRLDRLLMSLDDLSEEQLRFMVRVVKKIDTNIQATITRELENPNQPHKEFLLSLISEERSVITYESSLMKLVENESDVFLRLNAVKMLAFGILESSLRFLKITAERDQDMEIRIMAQRVCEIREKAGKRK